MGAAPPEHPASEASGTDHDLAVVVVNWRRPDETIDCCRRLAAWRQLETQVLVVDNASSEAVRDRLRRELPGVALLTSATNRGFAGGNNLALERVRADFVLLLNNDAWIEVEDAVRLLEFLRVEPEAGIAGPVLESTVEPHEVLAAGGRNILRHGRTHVSVDEAAHHLERERPFRVPYVPGTAALVRTALLRELGGFEESYFFSGEMADLAQRARQLGYASFVVPSARARHDLRVASDLRHSLYAYYSLRNRFLFARRHGRPVWFQLAHWAARGTLSTCAALLRGNGRQARYLAHAVRDGVAGRFGPADARLSP